MKKTLQILFFAAAAFELAAGVRFSDLALSGDPASRLLFSAAVSPDEQKQLFIAAPANQSISRLSILPEKIDVLDGKTLLIQGFYGVQTLPVSGGLPRSVPGMPSFTDPLTPSRADILAASPDGKWLLFIDPSGFSRGDLVLINAENGERKLVSGSVERPGRSFPASWSADSRTFLYAKSGKLYFYSVNNTSPPSDERYRFVGEGSINSVYWTRDGFYYLKGSALYKVGATGLFTRTSYPGYVEIGNVAGIIPFEFDPNFDSFRVSDNGTAMVLSKGGRNLFYYPLETRGAETSLHEGTQLPYILVPGAGSFFSVLWSGDTATILLGGKEKTIAAYRIKTGEKKITELAPPADMQGAVAPEGDRAVIWGKNGAVVYDYRNWKPVQILSVKPVYSCVWAGNELIVGGSERIERISFASGALTGTSELVCLASVSESGFDRDGNRVLARSGGLWFVTDGSGPWTEINRPEPGKPSIVSSTYRVYLDERRYGPFENMPMIRSFSDAATFPLFPLKNVTRAAIGEAPKRRQAVRETAGVFSHGSRTSYTIAFLFDLYDDDTGVYPVLETLSRYGVKASFFLNGEFIRRHPETASAIAEAGHETASMFYAPIVLSDSRYQINKEFIMRGLSRNEDAYFNASGKELALLWHPPWYAASGEIAAYASEAGYVTVAGDIDPEDWITRDDLRRTGMEQLSPADMIEIIMDSVQGGSIIPIRLGMLPGGRNEYLFNSLELLVDGLVRSGYEFVPVSRLDDFPFSLPR